MNLDASICVARTMSRLRTPMKVGQEEQETDHYSVYDDVY